MNFGEATNPYGEVSRWATVSAAVRDVQAMKIARARRRRKLRIEEVEAEGEQGLKRPARGFEVREELGDEALLRLSRSSVSEDDRVVRGAAFNL